MAIDFEAIITKHAGEDGNISAAGISKAAQAIAAAVGREFVDKTRYNAKLDEIETLKTEKQNAEDNATNAGKWEAKYNKIKEDFDAYKADVDAKAKLSTLKSAYRKLLEESGIDSKRLDTIIRATSFDGMKLDGDGKLENAADLKAEIEKDWADFKVSTRTEGAHVDNPPKSEGNNGANPRAAERARRYHEMRYGTAPASAGAENNSKE